jgi:hypothetical protein
MSRAECEEVLAAQRAAAEAGASIDVRECVQHPTPRCEEILRPILEAQRAAMQGGK